MMIVDYESAYYYVWNTILSSHHNTLISCVEQGSKSQVQCYMKRTVIYDKYYYVYEFA